MSVKEKMTAIADEIRKYTTETDKLSLDEMPTKISRAHDIGFENGVQKGIIDGYQEGYTEGKVEAETTASTEKNNLSLSLSEALTSGDNNVSPLEDNINQAKSDIGAIKTFIENYGKEVPVGTLSSTYPNMLDEVVIAEKNTSYMQGYGTGMEAGTEEGYQTGYTEGETAGVAKGKEAERDTFWKNYIATMNSNYNSYYAFAGFGWNNNTFRPTRSMYVHNATNMFSMSLITDLAGILEEQGVTIDFSGCSQFNSFAYNSKITHFPKISTVSASSLHGMFDYCYDTHTIDNLILKSDGSQTFTYTFRSCSKLKNIIISGTIGNSFDIRWSPLTKASIESVINALSTTTTGKTLSLKKTAVNTAFGIDVDDETTYPEGSEYYVLRHSRDNWTFSYK